MSIAAFMHISETQFAADCKAADQMKLDRIPMPKRATAGSAGYDFVSPVSVTMKPGESVLIPTGMRCRMENGWVLMLFPRSSLGFKHNVRLSNTVGVIDSDYFNAKNEGHIMVKLFNGGDHTVTIAEGERFCQGIFLPYGLAEEDKVAEERTGGIGSTGTV